MAALMVLHESKGPFSFAKENGPFGTPRERRSLAVSGLKNLCASGMGVPARQHCCARTGEPANLTRAPRSRARLRVVAKRRGSWRSQVHRTYTAQRVQSFKPQACNVGGRGERPSPFSGGSKGGILFGKRIPPFKAAVAQSAAPPPAQRAEQFANGFLTPFPGSRAQHKRRSRTRARENA